MIKRLWYRLICYLGFHRCNIVGLTLKGDASLECNYCDFKVISEKYEDINKAEKAFNKFHNELRLERRVLVEKDYMKSKKIIAFHERFHMSLKEAQEDYG